VVHGGELPGLDFDPSVTFDFLRLMLFVVPAMISVDLVSKF
jgi:hypothetical protein